MLHSEQFVSTYVVTGFTGPLWEKKQDLNKIWEITKLVTWGKKMSTLKYGSLSTSVDLVCSLERQTVADWCLLIVSDFGRKLSDLFSNNSSMVMVKNRINLSNDSIFWSSVALQIFIRLTSFRIHNVTRNKNDHMQGECSSWHVSMCSPAYWRNGGLLRKSLLALCPWNASRSYLLQGQLRTVR